MESVTLTELHEIPDEHLAQLIEGLTQGRTMTAARSPRLARVYTALLEALAGEQHRRQAAGVAHSAEPASVPLPTVGELSDAEMRELMRQMLEGRTAFAGGTPAAARFFDAVLGALEATRAGQQETLSRMERDLAGPG